MRVDEDRMRSGEGQMRAGCQGEGRGADESRMPKGKGQMRVGC